MFVYPLESCRVKLIYGIWMLRVVFVFGLLSKILGDLFVVSKAAAMSNDKLIVELVYKLCLLHFWSAGCQVLSK